MPAILVVEDDHTLRQMMTLELSEEGYEVVSATNGEEALGLMQQEEPLDLVLLDLIMPKVDGYAVLREMQSLAAAPRVIIMSNISDPEEMEKCRSLGAIDFVIKSNLDTDEFRATVKKHAPMRPKKRTKR